MSKVVLKESVIGSFLDRFEVDPYLYMSFPIWEIHLLQFAAI